MSSIAKLYKEIVEIEQILKTIAETNKQLNEVKKNIANDTKNTDTIISESNVIRYLNNILT